jgi:RNA polymerase sigma-70 factor (ECF subfamily)
MQLPTTVCETCEYLPGPAKARSPGPAAARPDHSFERLLGRLRGGDDDAARRLFARFAGRLVGLAHRQLDRRVRPKIAAEDVVQSVFKSFFRGDAGGRFDLGGWDGLWALLACITLRKCASANRRFRGPRRAVHREAGPPGDGGDGWAGPSRGPTAEEAAVLAETLERLLGALPAREKPVCQLRVQGYTVPEISERVGLTEYTVQGILKKLRKRLQGLCEGDVPSA